ncbi:hypothetical protein M3Y94_00944800 [Aphelenchoides besseyi]|nr:hypothetical protein M3Y94_00944800 [Aphelenchoides besseyi]
MARLHQVTPSFNFLMETPLRLQSTSWLRKTESIWLVEECNSPLSFALLHRSNWTTKVKRRRTLRSTLIAPAWLKLIWTQMSKSLLQMRTTITTGLPLVSQLQLHSLRSYSRHLSATYATIRSPRNKKHWRMRRRQSRRSLLHQWPKKEFNKKPAKAHSWAYAKNAEIARASRNREIARRKSLPERLSLYQIRRRAHSKNSANAMKKMKAAKSKRDDSDNKVATAKAKRESTKKVSERLDKDLNDAKAAFDGKKKVSAEVAALNATTPKVKSKSLKVERTQSETSTAHSISTRASTSQASTTQATTTRPTTRPTTDFTTDFTTDVTTDVTTDATTTDDTRSNY